MGISAKPVGKMKSMLHKITNEQEKEQHIKNKSKDHKEKKESQLIFNKKFVIIYIQDIRKGTVQQTYKC